jgi:hypothetical protein
LQERPEPADEKDGRRIPLAAPTAREEVHVVIGSLAGVALLYELVSMTHHHELVARLESPDNVWLAAACLFVFGWALALVWPRMVSRFALFATAAGWAAGAMAAYSNQTVFALPLIGFGLAGAAVAMVAFQSESQVRRPRTT